MTANEGFLKRVLDYLSFALLSFIAGLFIKTDLIVATSPQFFTTWSGYLLSKLKRKPWIFELRDIWPESIKSVGAVGSDRIIGLLEKIELFLYRDADKIVAVTDSFKENLTRRGITSQKIEIITNGVDLSHFQPQPKPQNLLNSLELNGKWIVGYIGTHGMAHNLDFILNSISELKDSSIHFLFIGDGAMKASLKQQAQDLKLKNVTFLDAVPKDQIPHYISLIDVALVSLRKSETFKGVLPSKIFENAAMRKPILLGVDGEARNLIEKYQSGLFYEPENRQQFISTLAQIKQPEIYEQLANGASKLAQNYDRNQLALRMMNIFKELS